MKTRHKRFAYHVTLPVNVNSILLTGLKPADRRNFPSRANGEIAIWIFLRLYDAVWWSHFHSKIYGRHPVLLRIDITGLKLGDDLRLPWISSRAIDTAVPPERVEVLHKSPS